MACSRCGSPRAETFLPDGSSACQPCFYQADIRRKEEVAAKNAMNGGIAALVVFVPILAVGAAFVKHLAILAVGVATGAIAGIRYARRVRRAHAEADRQAELRALQRGG